MSSLISLNLPIIFPVYICISNTVPSTTLHIALPGSGEGDEQAMFTSLFRTYGARIFLYFRKYVKRTEVAEDLLQEVFASLWARRHHLSEEKNIEAYLFVSARNHLYNHLKQLVAQTTVLPHDDDLDLSYDQVGEAINYKETTVAYYEALAALPPQRRRAFVLSREYGKSYKEIGEEMGISPRTVEKHISEALHWLKGKLNTSYTLCLLFIIW